MAKNNETVEPDEKTDDSILMFPNLFGDPSTRKVISMGIEAANNAPIKEAYNPGIIQS